MKMDIILGSDERIEARFDGLTVTTAQDGSAPAPFDLFLASMATCAAFYVSRFCSQRGIPTEGIRVTQTAHRDPETRMVKRIDIELGLPDSFPEKYHKAAIRAAEQCTVKKHLAEPPEIAIQVGQGAGVR